jgi:RNA polymerase sigma-70 factor, ECF subfamily
LRGDKEAEFTALVERQSRFAFRVAYSLLRNSYDSEDAVQEMFLNLYRKRAWTGLRDERAFVARAIWRMAIDRLRRRGHEFHETGELDDIPALEPDPERLAIGSDWSVMIHGLVDRLPEELRQPLALSTVNEMSSREIAKIMGIPEGTVRTRLMRARRLLRDKIMALEEGQNAEAKR